MFNKLLESTKGYLQQQGDEQFVPKERFDALKTALEEKDNLLKIKNKTMNDILNENGLLKKKIKQMDNLLVNKDRELSKAKEQIENLILQVTSYKEKELQSTQENNSCNDYTENKKGINDMPSIEKDNLQKKDECFQQENVIENLNEQTSKRKSSYNQEEDNQTAEIGKENINIQKIISSSLVEEDNLYKEVEEESNKLKETICDYFNIDLSEIKAKLNNIINQHNSLLEINKSILADKNLLKNQLEEFLNKEKDKKNQVNADNNENNENCNNNIIDIINNQNYIDSISNSISFDDNSNQFKMNFDNLNNTLDKVFEVISFNGIFEKLNSINEENKRSNDKFEEFKAKLDKTDFENKNAKYKELSSNKNIKDNEYNSYVNEFFESNEKKLKALDNKIKNKPIVESIIQISDDEVENINFVKLEENIEDKESEKIEDLNNNGDEEKNDVDEEINKKSEDEKVKEPNNALAYVKFSINISLTNNNDNEIGNDFEISENNNFSLEEVKKKQEELKDISSNIQMVFDDLITYHSNFLYDKQMYIDYQNQSSIEDKLADLTKELQIINLNIPELNKTVKNTILEEIENYTKEKEEELNKLNTSNKVKLKETVVAEINNLIGELKEKIAIKTSQNIIKSHNTDDYTTLAENKEATDLIENKDEKLNYSEYELIPNQELERILQILSKMNEEVKEKTNSALTNYIQQSLLKEKLSQDTKNKIKELENNIIIKDKEITEKSKQLSLKQLEINELTSQVNKSNEKMQHLIKENEEINNNKTEINESKLNIEKELKEKTEKLSSLEDEFNKYSKKHEELLQHYNLKDEEFEKLLEENTTMMEQKDTLLSEFQNFKTTFKQILLSLLNNDLFFEDVERVLKIEDRVTFYEEAFNLSKSIVPNVIYNIVNNLLVEEMKIKEILSDVEDKSTINSNNCEDDLYLNKNKDIMLKEILTKMLSSKSSSNDNISNTSNNMSKSKKKKKGKQNYTNHDNNTSNSSSNQFKEEIELFTSDLSKYSLKMIADKTINNKNSLVKLSFLTNLINNILESMSSQYTEIKDLKEDNRSKAIQLETTSNKEKNSKQALEEKINTQEELITSITKENKELHIKIKKFNTLYDEVKAEKEKLCSKVNQLSSQIEMFEVENTELSNKLNEKASNDKDNSDKLNKKTQEIEELHKQIRTFKEYKQRCEELEGQINLKANEIELIRKNFSELEEMLQLSKSKHDSDIELLQNNIHDLTEYNRSLEDQVRDYKAQISYFTDNQSIVLTNEEKSNLDKKLTNLEIENKHLKDTRNKMKEYCDDIIKKTKIEMAEKQYLIDRRVVSTHFLKIFDNSVDNNIKNAIKESLAKIFEYNNEERKKIGLYSGSFFGFFGGSSSSSNTTQTTTNIESHNDITSNKLQQLSDLLYDSIVNDD